MIFRRDADAGITHRHPYFTIFSTRIHIDLTTIRCELHRVGKQVDNHLLDHALISLDNVNGWVNFKVEVDAVTIGAFVDHPRGILEHLSQREAGALQFHMPRFHFRDVKDVIDQRQQMPPGTNNILQIIGLLRVQLTKHFL